MTNTLIITLPLIIVIETIAQWFLQKSTINIKSSYLNKYAFIGILLYAIVGYIYRIILINGIKLALANIIWNAGTSITVFFMSILYFGEHISIKQLFGAILISIGAFLIN
tara:strand:- start:442 stop:771 length:330 start_codon:yes stop_codon:yes gene_type:complete